MLKKYISSTLLFLLTFLGYAQSDTNIELDSISVEKFKRVQVLRSTPNLIEKLNDLGVDLRCGAVHSENFIQLELSEFEIDDLVAMEINFVVVNEDLQKFYEQRFERDYPLILQDLNLEKQKSAQLRGISQKNQVINNISQYYGKEEVNIPTPQNFYIPSSFGGCLTLEQMLDELDKMKQLYPDIISTKQPISSTLTTHEGRSVFYVKISDNPDSDETEPQVLYTGMTHAREIVSMMNIIYYMWYLLENYESDPYIKNLVNNTEMYFIPVLNPDGLAWNRTIAPNGGGMHRKNRNPAACTAQNFVYTTSNNGASTRGVDLNRNFPFKWGLGSSTDPCSQSFRGTSSGSEPETQMIMSFVNSKNFKIAQNHHSYGSVNVYGTHGSSGTATGRENEFYKFNHDWSYYSRYIYGPDTYIMGPLGGVLDEWMQGGPADSQGNTGSGKNILALTPENGLFSEGGFWPTTALLPQIKGMLRQNLLSAMYVGKHAKLHDLTMLNVESLNSNLTFGIERIGQTASNFTLTITPVSSNIVSITSPSVQTGMNMFEQRNLSIPMVLSNAIQNGDRIEFKVTLSNDDFVMYETNIVKYYNPTVLFSHNPDTQNLTGWIATGAWSTTTDAYSGTRAIRSTNVSPYANNTNSTLTLNSTFNFNNTGRKVVQFYTKWDLERNFDFVQLQASVNGGAWIDLDGKYTKPASISEVNGQHVTKTLAADRSFQNSNAGVKAPLYDGDTFNNWLLEEYIIDGQNNSSLLNQSNVRFRFLFRTDSANSADWFTTTFDGFYVDDFRIINVLDSKPEAYCVNKTMFLDASGALTITANDIDNGSYDEGSISSRTVTPNTFDCSHLGTTQEVILTVTDNLGNVSECTASIFINSNQNINATAPVSIYHNRFRATWEATCPTDDYYLDVATYPFGEESLVEWRFNANNTTATSGISANTSKTITKSTDFGTTSYVAGVTSNAISSTGWDSGFGSKAWVVEFSTIGRNNIIVSSMQRSSATGPKDFKLQYRIGAGSWIDVLGGVVMLADNFNAGRIIDLPLPAACNNQVSVSLRWIMTSNIRVTGGTTTVDPFGSSRIDDIIIKGTPDFTLPLYNNLQVSGSEHLVNGLNPNTTYYYRVRSVKDAYLSAYSNTRSVTTKQNPIIWNGTSWSNGTGPNANIGVIIQGNYNTASNGGFTTNDLTIESGILTIASGNSINNTGNPINVVNEIVNNGNETNLIIQNNANILQSNNIINSAPATVFRNTSPLMRLDYVLWGAPVSNQSLLAFSPNTLTNRFYTYNPNTDLYVNVSPSNNTFQAPNSYLIRMPDNHPTAPTVWNGNFKGNLNNGNFELITEAGKYYAVSNPYPSVMDAIKFMDDNNIEDPMYLWRKTNNSANPSYATFTRLGGVANSGGGSSIIPTRNVQVGQGFIVKASNNKIFFNNSMRSINHQNIFLKPSTNQNNNETISRFWIDLVGETFSNQMMVGYHPSATNNLDMFDAVAGNSSMGVYSRYQNSILSIQSFSNPFDVEATIPVRIKVPVAGLYEISLSQKDGIFTQNQPIYLLDKLTNIWYDLSESSVSLNLTTEEFSDRFEIKFQNILSTNVNNDVNFSYYLYSKIFNIRSLHDNISQIKVLDITGKLLLDQSFKEESNVQIDLTHIASNVLLIQVINNQKILKNIKIINH